MKGRKYRIVKDSYLGYEVQVKYRWWPFWIMIDGGNTYSSVEHAKAAIKQHKVSGGIVYSE